VARYDNTSKFKALDAKIAPYRLQFKYISFYLAWQNEVPERLNRTLIIVVKTIILRAKLPLKF
jgi:hypothetical protein